MEVYKLKERSRVLTQGRAVGEKIARGPVRVVRSARQLSEVRAGDILVTEKTDPDWEPTMKKAAAIVTDRGGRTCHAAIVSRELGLPAIVGTENATERLQDAQDVTVSCAEGEIGFVYDGSVDFEVAQINLQELPRPHTQLMMNVGNPEEAFRLSMIPNDGVGLAREEFIINTYIKIHPLALIDFEHLADRAARADIERLTAGYSDKSQFFVDKLAQGVAMIGAAFHPKDVIVRLSDFKTNEYANLIGGKAYEPVEENPMIGFRGASRYYDPRYQAGFAVDRKHHAGGGQIGAHHGLHSYGQPHFQMVKAFVVPVRNRAIGKQRSEAALAAFQDRSISLNVQVGFLLARKARIRQIFRGGATTNCDVQGFGGVFAQFVVSGEDLLLEIIG